MNKTTLVIMAAGMGSRFGKGIKQLEHVGPAGEILMDYSIYDAIKAGFNKVIIVIRRDIEEEFRKLIGDRISSHIEIKYVYQDFDNLPEGFTCPEDRKKPWGTGHAILACDGEIDSPFAIINADDFYGYEAFSKVHDYLANVSEDSEADYCMAGYILGNTLSDNGTVTRGICRYDIEYNLLCVDESFKLHAENGCVLGEDKNGHEISASPDSLVSMNMWGCKPVFMKQLKDKFVAFLSNDSDDPLKKEFLLPVVIDELIKNKEANVKILPVNEHWFGLTYIDDKPMVVKELKAMIDAGKYPDNLWN
ncbi:MAG: sugar phosphate nucleotidyltransferase [Lachnospiraceae bacterium]